MNNLYKDKSKINGVGLFSKISYKKNDHIAYIDGPIVVFRKFTPEISERMLDWIGVGKCSWINTDKSPFRFINHSCDPNVAHTSKRKVIALHDIPAGVELTMDYSLTEAEPGWEVGPCSCGAQKCRKIIRSIDTLPRSVYEHHKTHIPIRFRKIYEQAHRL